MARPFKKGVEYFPFNSSFFGERAIISLIGKHGTNGLSVYNYILCAAYNDNGYYTDYDDDFSYVVSQLMGICEDEINEIIAYLCERSLIDKELFEACRIFTSREIQTNFQTAVKARGRKTAISVKSEYWLLGDAETEPYIIAGSEGEDYSEVIPGNSAEGSSKKEKKKEKEIVVKKEKNKSSEEINNNDFFIKSNSLSAEDEAVISTYEQNIGRITPSVRKRLLEWKNNVEPDLISYAIELAAENGIAKPSYIYAILEQKLKEGITTAEQARSYEKSRKTPDCPEDDGGVGAYLRKGYRLA